MGEGGGGRGERAEGSSLPFSLPSFPRFPRNAWYSGYAARDIFYFSLSCEKSLIHANNHVIPRDALLLSPTRLPIFSAFDFKNTVRFFRGSREQNRPYSRCPSFLHALKGWWVWFYFAHHDTYMSTSYNSLVYKGGRSYEALLGFSKKIPSQK